MGLMDRLRETLHLGEKHAQNFTLDEERQRVGRESDQLPLGNRDGERWLPEHHVQIQALVGMGEARQYGVSSQQVEIKEGVTTFTHVTDGSKLHLDARGQFYSQDGKPIDRETAYEQRLPPAELKPSLDLSHDTQPQARGLKSVDDFTPQELKTFEQQGRQATLEFGRMSVHELQNERRQDPSDASHVRTNDAYRDTFRQNRILEYSVGPDRTEQYEWKQTSGNIESFQNKETGKYLHADNEGRFYNQERKEIPQAVAIQHAEPDRLIAPASNGIHIPAVTQAPTVEVVRSDLAVAAAPAIDKAPVQEHSLSM